MSLIQKKVLPFSVQAFHKDDFITVTEKDLLGHWSVFIFYPADFTFVCPTELEDVAKLYDQFQAINTEVYSISTDSHYVHKAWHESSKAISKVNYPMLADPAGKLARDFNVLVEDSFEALRGSFVLNPNGVIVAYEVHDMGIGRNAKELLRKVNAAQFVHENGDQVCPANWQPGDETLKPTKDLVGKI